MFRLTEIGAISYNLQNKYGKLVNDTITVFFSSNERVTGLQGNRVIESHFD